MPQPRCSPLNKSNLATTTTTTTATRPECNNAQRATSDDGNCYVAHCVPTPSSGVGGINSNAEQAFPRMPARRCCLDPYEIPRDVIQLTESAETILIGVFLRTDLYYYYYYYYYYFSLFFIIFASNWILVTNRLQRQRGIPLKSGSLDYINDVADFLSSSLHLVHVVLTSFFITDSQTAG